MAIDENTQTCTVVLHDDRVSNHGALCGTKVLSFGDLAYLEAPGAKTLCIVANKPSTNPDEVSIHVSLAAKFGFENRTKATVRLVEDSSEATATHVELFFRDQHLSRADMWRLSRQLEGTTVFRGQELKYLGSPTATVEAIYISGRDVESGYFLERTTKSIFRSGSARYTVLIQISKEMLEYWSDGDLMYERVLNGYLPELFHRWERLKARHLITVILFGRIWRFNTPINDEPARSTESMTKAGADDFFTVVASDTPCSQWQELTRKLKRAFNDATLPRQVSLAATGNMLEAIHLAAMDYADADIDYQLGSTGTSVIAITAGSGLFETSKDLLECTTSLLTGNGIGVDIVSMSHKPLHPVPLFSYGSSKEYALPHWVDISYWRKPREPNMRHWDWPASTQQNHDVVVPILDGGTGLAPSQNTDTVMADFDESAFAEVDHDPPNGKGPTEWDPPPTESDTKSATPSAPPSGSSADTAELPENGGVPQLSAPPSSMQSLTQRAKRDSLPAHPLMQSTRKISLGPKGLAPSRGLASTNVTTAHVHHGKESVASTATPASGSTSGLAQQIRATLGRKPSQQSLSTQVSNPDTQSTRPIDIQQGQETPNDEQADPASAIERSILGPVAESTSAGDHGSSGTPRGNGNLLRQSVGRKEDVEQWDVSPWVTLLNPSNPKRQNMRVASQFRKWQHVFPRPVSSGAFKWTSMCSPAALPLTNE